jgi:hypothetical protein
MSDYILLYTKSWDRDERYGESPDRNSCPSTVSPVTPGGDKSASSIQTCFLLVLSGYSLFKSYLSTGVLDRRVCSIALDRNFAQVPVL